MTSKEYIIGHLDWLKSNLEIAKNEKIKPLIAIEQLEERNKWYDDYDNPFESGLENDLYEL